MPPDNLFKDLTQEEANLSSRVLDLVIDRVFKYAYESFNEKTRSDMERTFLLEDDLEKEKFIKKNIPNFKKLFSEEAKKIEKQIKAEIEKQIK